MFGIKAANAAGMHSIGFRNPGSGNQDLSLSGYVVDSIMEAETIIKSLIV